MQNAQTDVQKILIFEQLGIRTSGTKAQLFEIRIFEQVNLLTSETSNNWAFEQLGVRGGSKDPPPITARQKKTIQVGLKARESK